MNKESLTYHHYSLLVFATSVGTSPIINQILNIRPRLTISCPNQQCQATTYNIRPPHKAAFPTHVKRFFFYPRATVFYPFSWSVCQVCSKIVEQRWSPKFNYEFSHRALEQGPCLRTNQLVCQLLKWHQVFLCNSSLTFGMRGSATRLGVVIA